jgi:ABC-type amino acid transport system permease subunit
MMKFILVLCAVLIGIAMASFMGRMNRQKKRNTGKSGAWGVAFLVTIGVVVAVGFAIAGCVSMRLCTSGGDTDLAYVFYLLFAAPIYWFFAETFAAKK